MSAAQDVDVVIPTWNGRELLRRCLPTLAQQSRVPHVIVVDNGSDDGTAAFLRAEFPDVELVRLEENRGFAGGVNRGIEAGASPFVVLVNNDVECDPDFVERIVAPLHDDRSMGMVAGLLLRPGREEVDSYGIELDRTLGAFPRFAGRPYNASALHERFLAVPSGGAAAYRRAALVEVGYFDENLFAYMEDVDLGLRIRSAGWKCSGARDAVGIHLGGATFGRRSRWQVEVSGASRGYMLRKYGTLGLRTAAVELAVVAGETVLGRDLAALRGRVAGWKRAPARAGHVPPDAINPELGLRESLRRRLRTLPAHSLQASPRPSRSS
jgi:GT2 family glycosyltransferase